MKETLGQKKVFGVLAVVILVLGLALVGLGISRTVAGKGSPTDSMRGVVFVYTEFTDKEGDWIGTGTGFFVGELGQNPRYVITNGHVIQEAERWGGEIRVYFNAMTNDYVVPTVAWVDYHKDIAVLDIGVPTDKRVALPLFFRDAIVKGEQVYALGYPGASDSSKTFSPKDGTDITITTGIVSELIESNPIHAIQTDTDIAPGNSGGPLVNARGDVVGINTWKSGETGTMSFAIAIDEIVPALNEIGAPYSVADHFDVLMVLSWVVGIVLVVFGLLLLLLVTRARRQMTEARTASAVAAAAAANANALAAANAASQNAASAAAAIANAQDAKVAAAAAIAAAKEAKDAAEKEAELEKQRIALDLQALEKAEQAEQARRNPVRHPVLVCVAGQFAGAQFDLDKRLNLGRDPSRCNLVFDPEVPGVSGFHCSVSYDQESERFKLEDHSSTYGTFFGDGQRIDPARPAYLASGDGFYLASRDNSFQVGFGAEGE